MQQRLGLGEGLLGRPARGCGWGPGRHAACRGPGLPLREPARRWYDGALALPLARHAGAGAEPVLARAALMLLGAANGGLDVSMNAQAVVVERGYGRPIMSSFHAAWSFGGLAGAALGDSWLPSGWAPAPFLCRSRPLCDSVRRRLQGALAFARRCLRGRGAGVRPSDAGSLGLGIISFCVLLGEGAMGDWSAVYLTTPWGRARLRRRGIRGVLRLDGLRTPLRRWAYRAPGLGHTRPLVRGPRRRRTWHRAGRRATPRRTRRLRLRRRRFLHSLPRGPQRRGRTEGMTGPALAAVSTAAYTGFLVGPPFIGFLAELTGLGYALYLVVALSVAVVVFGGAVKTGGKAK